MLYHMAPTRITQIAEVFEQDSFELFIGIRNPAAFLPALFQQSPQADMESFMRGFSPKRVRWSETLTSLRHAVPEIPITAWCFEDMPMLWAEIVRSMAGLDPAQKIVGGFDLLREIMTGEGMQRFRAYLAMHPTMTERQKRRVISAFLDKFAKDEELEEELDAPGWTDDDVEEITELYEDDVALCARIPGVTFLTP
jgi:hypothetical protein